MTDEELIDIVLTSKSIKDSEAAFSELYNRYFYFVYDLLRTLGVSKNNCEDLIQDIFLKVYRNLHKFKRNKKFFPWFYSVVKNEGLKFIKKNRKNIVKSIDQEKEFLTLSTRVSQEDVTSIITIRQIIESLDIEEREIVFLRYYQDMKVEDIARILKISERKVYYILSNFKSLLIEKFK